MTFTGIGCSDVYRKCNRMMQNDNTCPHVGGFQHHALSRSPLQATRTTKTRHNLHPVAVVQMPPCAALVIASFHFCSRKVKTQIDRNTSAPCVLSTTSQPRGRPASRCSSYLGREHFRQCEQPMHAREVRSGFSRRDTRNKGGTTIRRPPSTL